jgi:hypothetical protein
VNVINSQPIYLPCVIVLMSRDLRRLIHNVTVGVGEKVLGVGCCLKFCG